MRKPRILFVDDHEDTRDLALELLGAQGYDVTTADSFTQGLALAQTGDFDLLLLDDMLADGTGKELCQKIRKFDPDTPILFFSANHPKLLQAALACGAQGFVLKPDIDGLLDKVRRTFQVVA